MNIFRLTILLSFWFSDIIIDIISPITQLIFNATANCRKYKFGGPNFSLIGKNPLNCTPFVNAPSCQQDIILKLAN